MSEILRIDPCKNFGVEGQKCGVPSTLFVIIIVIFHLDRHSILGDQDGGTNGWKTFGDCSQAEF